MNSTILGLIFIKIFLGVVIFNNLATLEMASAARDAFRATSLNLPVFSVNTQSIINCSGIFCTGTNNDDIIIGSILAETISGLDGNDKIQANGGNDIVLGGKGDDIISGGNGFDKLFGQDGNDVIIADAYTSLVPQDRESQIAAIKFLDELLTGTNNTLQVNAQVNANALIDMNESRTNPFEIQDSTNPMFANVSLLNGGNGDDFLLGQNGNEFFVGGPGRDYFDCNEGIDTVLDYKAGEDTVNVNCENLEQDDTI